MSGGVRATSLVLILTAGVCIPLIGQGAAGAEPVVQVHGFLLGLLAGRTSSTQARGSGNGDFTFGEERLRLDLSATSASGEAHVVAKGDLFHDAVEGRVAVDLREAYAAYTRPGVDLRLGRQIVTWGVGDLFFITDVFPKDWESLFGGRPAEYLKQGVDGVRARLSMGETGAEVVVVPFFTPDVLPSPARFDVTDPLASVPDQLETRPSASYSNTEIALRLFRRLAGFDLSVVAYRGFWRTPGVRLEGSITPPTVTRFYPRLWVYGLSAQRSALGGVLSLETGDYRSADERPGDLGGLPGSQWRFLIGYQRQLWKDFGAGVQLYGELRDEGGGAGVASDTRGRLRRVISVRLTQLLGYDAWKLSVFAAYSPSDADGFLRPEVSFKVTDELGVSVGANVFAGRSDDTFFGRFRRSDNAFTTARFEF